MSCGNKLPEPTLLSQSPQINGNHLHLSFLKPPWQPCEDRLTPSGAISCLPPVTFLMMPSASGRSRCPLSIVCLSDLSWTEGLFHSPEMARNMQEARSHAQRMEVRPHGGLCRRLLISLFCAGVKYPTLVTRGLVFIKARRKYI